jgi:hypothetical protein
MTDPWQRAWHVISIYSDGDRVIESPRYMNKAHAEDAAAHVAMWREDQDEMPRIVVEEVEP